MKIEIFAHSKQNISINTVRQFKLAQYVSEKWHILWDLNTNLYWNDSILEEENKNIMEDVNKIYSKTKKVSRIKLLALKQIIKSLTRVIPNTPTLIDHILTNTNEEVTQCGLVNIGLSDHQMIFCTRNIEKEKEGGHKQIPFRSFKNIQ